MKKICVGFLSAFFGLAALAAATRAQELDQLIVNVPYDFVVSGKTLPAGAYRVKRANDRDNHVLAITSLENGGGVLLLFLHLSALYYGIARRLFLRDAGRKLTHMDRQLGTAEGLHEDLRVPIAATRR